MSQTNQLIQRPLDYYLSLRYPVIFYPDEDGGYTAEIKELSGCLTQGETLEETMENIEDARDLWIKTAYEHGDHIPVPVTEVSYSGKCLLRMPRSLHQKLAEGAEREGTSLNQYLVFLLSEKNTSRQNISTISGQILDGLKKMKLQNVKQGIKQGKNIVLSQEPPDISDGTAIMVAIKVQGIKQGKNIILSEEPSGISERMEITVTIKLQGIKQGRNIILAEEIPDIADGTEITIEILEGQILTLEERRKQLDQVIGAWKNSPEIDEILAKIDKRRETEPEE